MNKPGVNLELFKKSYNKDNYWFSNLGLKDFQIIDYLFNRIYQEEQILDQFELCQRIVDYTRVKQSKVAKVNAHIYEEIRCQFESHQNELRQLDWQLDSKLKKQNEEISRVFGE